MPFEAELKDWRLKEDHRTYISMSPIKPEFDDSEWMQVPVGIHLQLLLHADDPYWKDEVKALNDKPWWYRTRFILPEKHKSRLIRLRFQGVDYYASVWVNGIFLGHHEGCFAPFEYDISKIVLFDRENTVSVRVEAPWDIPLVTATDRGQRLGGIVRNMVKGMYEHADGLFPPYVNPIGIWRPVKLLISGALTVSRIFVMPKLLEEREAELTLRLMLTNYAGVPKSAKVKIRIEGETFHGLVAEEELTETLQPGAQEIIRTYRVSNPRLWWPWDQGSPDLHKVTVTLTADDKVSDKQTEVFGIREVSLVRSSREMYFTIDQRKIFIRGSTYIPDVYLSRMTLESYRRDMELVKEANLNLIRLHVHVERPELYDLCDRMGIMIYQDFELNWAHPATQEWEEQAVLVFGDMMRMLQNHPSIVVWCCHNEPPNANYSQHPDPRLFEEAMKLDPTRPVIQGSGRAGDYIRSGDSHTYQGSLNRKVAEYSMVYNSLERLNTEYGVDAPPSLVSLKLEPGIYKRLRHIHDRIEALQDYQSELVKYYTEHYRRTKYNPCSGYCHFMFVDCAPSVFYGVLDFYRAKKKAYETLKNASSPILICFEYYRDEPKAIWVVNDSPMRLENCQAEWEVTDSDGNVLIKDKTLIDVEADSALQVTKLNWKAEKNAAYDVSLGLRDRSGKVIAENRYHDPLHQTPRPSGYPELFDIRYGMRVWSE